jgi:RsiW-degrading membrane proteinase PrsW (M82 family)
MSNTLVLLFFGLFLPFLLWPIEYLLPFPYVIEELAKYFSLLWLKNTQFKKRSIVSKSGVITAILFALFFSLTESIMYLLNYFVLGNFETLPTRLVFTTLMHIVTTLIIFFSLDKNKFYQFLAVIAAMIIHFGFNSLIQS